MIIAASATARGPVVQRNCIEIFPEPGRQPLLHVHPSLYVQTATGKARLVRLCSLEDIERRTTEPNQPVAALSLKPAGWSLRKMLAATAPKARWFYSPRMACRAESSPRKSISMVWCSRSTHNSHNRQNRHFRTRSHTVSTSPSSAQSGLTTATGCSRLTSERRLFTRLSNRWQ